MDAFGLASPRHEHLHLTMFKHWVKGVVVIRKSFLYFTVVVSLAGTFCRRPTQRRHDDASLASIVFLR